jgi:hypothetical protein
MLPATGSITDAEYTAKCKEIIVGTQGDHRGYLKNAGI